jgi:hypothetical protein
MESHITNIFIRYLFDIGIINGKTVTDLITTYTNIKKNESTSENNRSEFKMKMTSALVYYINSLSDEQKENLSSNILMKFFVNHQKKKEQQLKTALNIIVMKISNQNIQKESKYFYKWNNILLKKSKTNSGNTIPINKDKKHSSTKHMNNYEIKNLPRNNLLNNTLRQKKTMPSFASLEADISSSINSIITKNTKNQALIVNKIPTQHKKNNALRIHNPSHKKFTISSSRTNNHQNAYKEQLSQELSALTLHNKKHKSRSLAHQQEKSWDKKEREVFEGCTFTPSINSSKTKSGIESEIPVYERLYNTKQKYDSKKVLKALELEHAYSKENTFKPELNAYNTNNLKRQHSFSSFQKRKKSIDDAHSFTSETPKKNMIHSQRGNRSSPNCLESFNNNVKKLRNDLGNVKKSKSFIDNPNVDIQKLEKVYSNYKAKIKRNEPSSEKYSKVEKEEITKKIIQRLYGSNKSYLSHNLFSNNGLPNGNSANNSCSNIYYNSYMQNEPREQLYIEDFYLNYNK